MIEYSHGSFYQNDATDQKFIDVHLSIKVALEWFLSTLLFKGDLKRVIYSSQDMAFRRRIEYLDTKQEYNEKDAIRSESLELPFASYINTSDPEPDDRPAAASAAQSIIGEWDEDFETSIRSLAVKQTYKATLFFARRDEVRLAQQLLLWEKEPKFPVRMYHTIKWRNCNLTIPINVSIENINTSPDYKETDWLTKNRIFPVEVEMTVRSYQILVNTIEKLYQLPIRFSNIIDDYDEFDPPSEYITEQVILDWAAGKFDINTNSEDVDFESEDIQNLLKSPYFFNQKAPNIKLENMKGDADNTQEDINRKYYKTLESFANLPNDYTTDVVQGYFQTDPRVELSSLKFNPNKSNGATGEAHFDFELKPSGFRYFSKLTISIPLKETAIITDCHAKFAKMKGLVQGSSYKATVNVYSTDGTIKTYFLSFTMPRATGLEEPDKTPSIPVDKAPVISKNETTGEITVEKINKTPGLVGMRLF